MSSPGVSDVSKWGEIVGDLRTRYGDNIAVVLNGSFARSQATEESDIDLLVVAGQRLATTRHLPRYHIQVSSEAEFLRNLAVGEDFEAWCVRFGVPLYDAGPWKRILGSTEASSWPKWESKIPHAARRLFMASTLLKMGDAEAASEETLFALCHVARALLLRAGVFPLSRPELEEQLQDLGYLRLAKLHGELRRPAGTTATYLRLAQRYSKKLLLHLDADIYAQCSKAYREKMRAKSSCHR